MPKLARILIACLLCLVVIIGAVWLVRGFTR